MAGEVVAHQVRPTQGAAALEDGGEVLPLQPGQGADVGPRLGTRPLLHKLGTQYSYSSWNS